MSETKNVVLTIRLAPSVMGDLSERAKQQRQPVRRLAAMIISDWCDAVYVPPMMVETVRTVSLEDVSPPFGRVDPSRGPTVIEARKKRWGHQSPEDRGPVSQVVPPGLPETEVEPRFRTGKRKRRGR